VLHYYNLWDGSAEGKRAIIQGWGNVGGAAGYYLAKSGVKIVGIIDRIGGLINPDGFTYEEVKQLFLDRVQNTLYAHNMLSFEEMNARVWSTGAEIFIPAAASRLVTQEQVETMIHHGLEVIGSGANVPFQDPQIFFGPIAAYTDKRVSLIPDFIANCGMARVFAYLMETKNELTDEAILQDVSDTIRQALEKVYAKNPESKNIAKTAFEIALQELLGKDKLLESPLGHLTSEGASVGAY